MGKSKSILLLLVLLSNVFRGNAQEYRIELVKGELFHGTWIAGSGEMEYEFDFKRGRFPYTEDEDVVESWIECDWGVLTMSLNGAIVSKTNEEGFDSGLRVISPSHIHFWYIDYARNLHAGLDFILDGQEPDKATVKVSGISDGIFRQIDSKITDSLIFRKVGRYKDGEVMYQPEKARVSRTLGNTDLFHGRWVAHLDNENTEYEIKFERGVFALPSHGEISWIVDGLFGRLIICENGEIVKETAEAGLYSAIRSLRIKSPHHIEFRYYIRERGFTGNIEFIIDEDNPFKAVLNLYSREQHSRGDYDIPDRLTFWKME